MYSFENMLERIKSLKKKNNMTNDILAHKSGIPLGTLSKILSGNTKDPQISNIIKISQALSVSADYILFGNKPTTNNFDDELNQIIKKCQKLNKDGKKKVINYIDDLTINPKYTSEDAKQHPPNNAQDETATSTQLQ